MRPTQLPTFILGTRRRLFLLSAFLLALVGASATAAAQAAPPELILVVEARDTTCAVPQPSDAGAEMGRVHWLSPALLESYHRSAAAGLTPVESVLDDTLQSWGRGDFLEALERSSTLLPVLHDEARYVGSSTHEALQRAGQLRLVLLLLEGREDDAELEADLLLSRHSAALYCAAGDYPESCALLRERERALPWTWDHSVSTHLHELRAFADARGAQLLHLELRKDSAVIHVPASTRPPLIDHTLCDGGGGFDGAEERWRAHLPEMEHLRAPPPKRAASWALVGVSAALLSAAIVSAAFHGPNASHFNRCLESSVGCEGPDALQASHRAWQRSKRATLSLSISAVLGAAAIYPARRLESRTRLNRDDPRSLRGELHAPTAVDPDALSRVADGLAPE